VRDEARVTLNAEWTNGWLVFESTGEKRRLSRYPDDWSAMSDDGLRNLLNTAKLLTVALCRSSDADEQAASFAAH